ncbi:MAG: hypothetical protein AAFY58_06855, partial [Planctomycetota bacterium]
GASALVIDKADPAAGPSGERSVGGVRAVRAGLGDVWVFDPPGRLRAESGLPGWGRVVGAAALERGAAVLISEVSVRAGVTSYELRVLVRGRWRECVLPADFASAGRAVGLVAMPDAALGVVAARGETITLWSGVIQPPSTRAFTLSDTDESGGLFGAGSLLDDRDAGEPEAVAVDWDSTTLVAPIDSAGRVLLPASGAIGWAYESLVYAVPGADGSKRVIAASADGGMVLAEVAGAAGTDSAFVPMGDRAVLTWVEQRERAVGDSDSPGEPERVWRIHEISTATGETLFAGPVRQEGPISRREFQAMSIVLVALMIGLLVFVLRPDPADGVANLPPNTAITSAEAPSPARNSGTWSSSVTTRIAPSPSLPEPRGGTCTSSTRSARSWLASLDPSPMAGAVAINQPCPAPPAAGIEPASASVVASASNRAASAMFQRPLTATRPQPRPPRQ